MILASRTTTKPTRSLREHASQRSSAPRPTRPIGLVQRPAIENGDGVHDPGDGLAWTDYGGLFGVSFNTPGILPEHEGVMLYDRAISIAGVRDGLSNTAVIGECTGRGLAFDGQWANGHNLFDQRFDQPVNVTRNNELYADHPDGVNLARGDGGAFFLSESTDQQVLIALLTRAGGEVVSGR